LGADEAYPILHHCNLVTGERDFSGRQTLTVKGDRPICVRPDAEAMTREQALRFYTINNAYLLYPENRIRSLAEGRQADFVVINQDLLACPEDEIRQAYTLATYLDGKRVFELQDCS
jgi:predicted amidohydrolase YtcJ